MGTNPTTATLAAIALAGLTAIDATNGTAWWQEGGYDPDDMAEPRDEDMADGFAILTDAELELIDSGIDTWTEDDDHLAFLSDTYSDEMEN